MAYDVSKVANVARKLQEAGQSDEEVKARLRAAGIDDATIAQALQAASLPAVEQPTPPIQQPVEQGKLSALIARRIEQAQPAYQNLQGPPQQAQRSALLEQLPTHSLVIPEVESLAQSIQMSSDSHAQRLDSLKEVVESHKFSTDELQKELKALRHDTTTLLEVDAKTFGQKLSGLERDLKEVKASTSALEDLMRKVLDSQRELVKLSKK